ncbi:MAG: hypothetical protein ACOC4C_05485 [Fibrobacterota bacterium]
MRHTLIIFFFSALLFFPLIPAWSKEPEFFESTYSVRDSSKAALTRNFPDSITLFFPVYTNADQLTKIVPIPYKLAYVSFADVLDSLPIGTTYISPDIIPLDTIKCINIMAHERFRTFQLIKTESRGYIGYLEEMLNVPFMLPPKFLKGYGHQADHRIAVDCAELAIYGKRRQGYNIPYGGPRGIKEYLSETDSISRGTIIHFGFQVSVVYEDRGKIGALDNEDLLIHAYKDKAEIIPLGKTDLTAKPYTACTWKDSLPRFD